MLNIEVQKGDITQVKADAIVNPANSLGYMLGGAAVAIKKSGGEEIEQQLIERAPLEIGKAILTQPGKLPFKVIIHSATMVTPASGSVAYNISMAVRGALHLADDKGFKVIAMPGMGTGTGAFPKKDAAKVMVQELEKFNPINLEKVILLDLDEELVEAWGNELNKK